LGDNAVMQQVMREPSKAENEEDVTDADRAKHEQYGSEIEADLHKLKQKDDETAISLEKD